MIELLKQHITSVVFPPHCMQCEVALEATAQHQWCMQCIAEMIGKEVSSCLRCSAHLQQVSPFAEGCAVCYQTSIEFASAISIGNYRGQLQHAIREMKRSKSEPMANQLGRLLAHCMQQQEVGCRADLIVPMPIHWWKRLRRGFNASSLIADGISKTLGIRQIAGAMRYSRLTKKQGTLSTTARIRNVKGAIQVRWPKSVQDKHVVLVDDVTTSCATANEAAKALLKAGAREVTLAVAARGVRAS